MNIGDIVIVRLRDSMHQLPDRFRRDTIRIAVIGAGGNGSMLLPHLARIHKSLHALGRRNALDVTVWDHDAVTESNLGRQAYSAADLGRNKACIAVPRINLFFGLDWEARPERMGNPVAADITISCVDNLQTRKSLAFALWANHYWLDLGNSDTSGQVVLGGNGLPTLFDLFPELSNAPEDSTAPSCSVAEALARQDLFINSTLANLAGHLLWTLLRKGELRHHGYFVNLESGRVSPLPIPNADSKTNNQTNNAPGLSPGQRVGVRRPRARTGKGAVRRGRARDHRGLLRT